jgi:hypothetical protein
LRGKVQPDVDIRRQVAKYEIDPLTSYEQPVNIDDFERLVLIFPVQIGLTFVRVNIHNLDGLVPMFGSSAQAVIRSCLRLVLSYENLKHQQTLIIPTYTLMAIADRY